MLRTHSLQYINPSCPQGGSWFVCPFGSRFLGCCASDPCQNGCPGKNLKAASFNASDYGQFANQECATGQFYTCDKTNPPFLGCCTINPCDAGQCPQTDLAPAFLSNDSAEAADFLSSATFTTATTLSVSKSTIIVATMATLTPTASPHPPPANPKISDGAIIGIALGSFVFCAWLLAISMILFTRRSRARQLGLDENPPNSAMETNDYTLGASDSGNANNHSCSPLSLGNVVQNLAIDFPLTKARLLKPNVDDSGQPRPRTRTSGFANV